MSLQLKIMLGGVALLAVVAVWRVVTYEDMDSDEVRIRKLERAGDVAGLAKEIGHKKLKVVRKALSALGRIGSDEAVGQIAKTLSGDKRPKVRAAAAVIIGKSRACREMDAVLTAMIDASDPIGRRSAAEAAWRIFGRNLTYDPKAPHDARRAKGEYFRMIWNKDKERIIEHWETRKKRPKEGN